MSKRTVWYRQREDQVYIVHLNEWPKKVVFKKLREDGYILLGDL